MQWADNMLNSLFLIASMSIQMQSDLDYNCSEPQIGLRQYKTEAWVMVIKKWGKKGIADAEFPEKKKKKIISSGFSSMTRVFKLPARF